MRDDGTERRGFFRINDEIALSYRLLSAVKGEISDYVAPVEGAHSTSSLANELEKLREVSRVHFRQVEKESLEIARYFTLLEKKIDLIAHHVLTASNDLFTKNTQPVSISGSGLAFSIDEKLNIGDLVELKFILKPSLVNIVTNSTVVSCQHQAGQFRVAVEYDRLSDEERDLLIRHVVRKQMNDIRELKT